jgi:hypothetical protein
MLSSIMRHTVAYSTVFPLFLNADKHYRLVFSSLFEPRFAHKICFPLSPSLHCQRLFSALLTFTTLSQLVLKALDLFFPTSHSDEWRFPDISAKVAVFHPGGDRIGVLSRVLIKVSRSSGSVRVRVGSDQSDYHPPHTIRCQIYIMAPDNVQVHSP